MDAIFQSHKPIPWDTSGSYSFELWEQAEAAEHQCDSCDSFTSPLEALPLQDAFRIGGCDTVSEFISECFKQMFTVCGGTGLPEANV